MSATTTAGCALLALGALSAAEARTLAAVVPHADADVRALPYCSLLWLAILACFFEPLPP